MASKKDLVEEAIIQMKNVEQAIAENAKGILQSTMKEEISQLVKESLKEQTNKDEEELDDEGFSDEEELDDESFSDEEELDDEGFSDEEEFDPDVEDEDYVELDDVDISQPIDMRNSSKSELLRVFKAMGPEDGIIVTQDNDIHLSDSNTDSEYIIKLMEGYDDSHLKQTDEMYDEELDEMYDEELDEMYDEELDEMYDEELDEMYDEELDEMYDEELDEMYDEDMGDDDDDDMGDDDDDDMGDYDDDDYSVIKKNGSVEDVIDTIFKRKDDENIYEIEFSDDELDEVYDDDLYESYSHKKQSQSLKKPIGVKGTGPKFEFNGKLPKQGFNTKKKKGPESIGTGKASKFKFHTDAENVGGKNTVVKQETKEAARGYAFGPKGLRKGITNNRNLKEDVGNEVEILRQKNEEYRRALNVFREKLNEVAVFNSNLAYATRLFTEHSTTKKEKINILRRFDNVESLKESKNLYRSIKDELTKSSSQSINENVEKRLNRSASSGSSTTLIESTTYENPQFLRMKDLMSKIA